MNEERCPVCDKMLDRVAENTLECPGCRCQFHPQHVALARATRAAELAAAVKPLLALISDLYDREPCRFDHHGYCQTHGWMETDPKCPHYRALLIPPATAGRRE
jgi:hypothetical protein